MSIDERDVIDENDGKTSDEVGDGHANQPPTVLSTNSLPPHLANLDLGDSNVLAGLSDSDRAFILTGHAMEQLGRVAEAAVSANQQDTPSQSLPPNTMASKEKLSDEKTVVNVGIPGPEKSKSKSTIVAILKIVPYLIGMALRNKGKTISGTVAIFGAFIGWRIVNGRLELYEIEQRQKIEAKAVEWDAGRQNFQSIVIDGLTNDTSTALRAYRSGKLVDLTSLETHAIADGDNDPTNDRFVSTVHIDDLMDDNMPAALLQIIQNNRGGVSIYASEVVGHPDMTADLASGETVHGPFEQQPGVSSSAFKNVDLIDLLAEMKHRPSPSTSRMYEEVIADLKRREREEEKRMAEEAKAATEKAAAQK